jgi:hypothetical protein
MTTTEFFLNLIPIPITITIPIIFVYDNTVPKLIDVIILNPRPISLVTLLLGELHLSASSQIDRWNWLMVNLKALI